MYSNQILLDLIFLKNTLKIENEKLLLLSNILFSNFTNKDTRFKLECLSIREIPFQNEVEEEIWTNQEQSRKSKLPITEDHEEPEDYI